MCFILCCKRRCSISATVTSCQIFRVKEIKKFEAMINQLWLLCHFKSHIISYDSFNVFLNWRRWSGSGINRTLGRSVVPQPAKAQNYGACRTFIQIIHSYSPLAFVSEITFKRLKSQQHYRGRFLVRKAPNFFMKHLSEITTKESHF